MSDDDLDNIFGDDNNDFDDQDGAAGATTGQDQSSRAHETKLFVGSLALTTDDAAVRRRFEEYGDLVECKVALEPITGSSRGFAFVTFRYAEDAQRAKRELNGADLDGRKIKVEYPKDRRSNWAAQREADRRARIASEPPPPVTYKELPFDKANNIPFVEICAMLDKIRSSQGIQQKLHILFHTSKLQDYLKNASWYPIMRLILPDYDRERPRYNLKEQALAKLIIRSLGFRLSDDHPDVIRLHKWKDPSAMKEYKGGAIGDFPSVLREVLERRGYKATSMRITVGEVNSKLDRLHAATGDEDRLTIMREFINSCDAAELYWLTRIILKDMNCGLKADSVLKRYHKDAVEAITATGDLRRVIAELSDPEVSRAYTVELFQPFSPMLAKMVRIDTATEKLGDFVIEPKMDGDRMLVHIDKTVSPPKVMLFTRNMNDYTHRYGSPELFSYFLQAFHCNKCIVDGEMLSWDDSEQRVMEFGQTTTVANEMNSGANYTRKRWLFYVCFDLLFVEESNATHPTVITGEALKSRRNRLQSIFRPISKRVEMVESLPVRETDLDRRHEIVMAELDKMIQTKGEGLILKSLNSPYTPGEQGRKSGQWVKVKPEHVSGLAEELDCLILGGYYAEGARRASEHELDPSVFLVGVPGGSSSKKEFFCLAKVGSGYTLDHLRELRQKLRPHLIKTSSGKKPSHFVMPQRKDDLPDVWLPPEKSVVVQITGSELVPCDWFSANYTLRFPRMTRIRYDKSWEECTPFSEVERFAKDFQAGTGLHGRRRAVDISRLDAAKIKQGGLGGMYYSDLTSLSRRKRARPEEVLRVGSISHLNAVEAEDDVPLDGLMFFVYPCEAGFGPIKNHPDMVTQQQVESYLKRKGGKVVKAVPQNKYQKCICIASEKSFPNPPRAVLNVIRSASHDLFKMDFIVDCCEGKIKSINEPEFSDYLAMSAETRAGMADLDEFGDHYYQKSDALGLQRCMDEVAKKHGATVSATSGISPTKSATLNSNNSANLANYKELLDDEDDPLAIPSNLFRGMFAFIPTSTQTGKFGDLDAMFYSAMVRLHGGICVNSINDPQITHVILTSQTLSKAPELLDEWKKHHKGDEEVHPPEFVKSDLLLAMKEDSMQATWDLFPKRHEYIIEVN